MIDRIDHVVLNCRDVDAMAEWYERVLGFEREEFFGPIRRIALKFGRQKINPRPSGTRNWMTGEVDSPGALDLCFITEEGIDAATERLRAEAYRHRSRTRCPEGRARRNDLCLFSGSGRQLARDRLLRVELGSGPPGFRSRRWASMAPYGQRLAQNLLGWGRHAVRPLAP